MKTMNRPTNLNPFSLTQLYFENRKQQAHLKKINEMKRESQLDNRTPTRFPHLHQGFIRQLNDKNQEIVQENKAKSKRLVDIMATKKEPMPEPFHPKPSHQRARLLNSSFDQVEYEKRIARAKGKYDARKWRQSYEEHKDHLKLTKNNHVFTPLGIGINRKRVKQFSTVLGKNQIPSASSMNLDQTTAGNQSP